MKLSEVQPARERPQFLPRFILLLLFVLALENGLVWAALRFLFHQPRIPQYRLIGAACQAAAFLAFLLLWKPSLRELGLDGSALTKRSRTAYAAGTGLILLMVISSYFIMRDIRLFALATNVQFGLVTPVVEETLFRGVGWNGFIREGRSPWKALAWTSFLFSLYHIGYWPQIAYATAFHPEAPPMIEIVAWKTAFAAVLGAGLGWLRWKTGSVFGPILLHSFLNIISP